MTEADGLQYRSDIVASLTHVIGTWTTSDFIAAVARSSGVELDTPSIVTITLIARGGPQRPSALAHALVTGASNMSKIIARLESAAFVERRTDPDDARASLVHLTDRGADVARSLTRAGDTLIEALLVGWSAADRNEFARLLSKFDASSSAYARRSNAHPDAARES
ncbi:DNA-binding transcriptional regulator, MarR family [Paramicrobacterium humi]|uniref:DNA-binding transcriptional regulator, MarR family n=1 Tax=Paramicrobacterium humi TaxID=640635 RepID=A0A1H4LD34_9MICO|nr:MarR family transcriptional regulator [Microbacterium humi]SEB68593.1 DNA-binding transcriptional regulator, MarR family [Microbacterium humi]